jgi:uncharacterized protein YneF (UPF0154 family)
MGDNMNQNATTQSSSDYSAKHTLTPPKRKRRRWLHVLLGIIIFILGMIVGSGGTIIAAKNKIEDLTQNPEKASRRIAERLKRKLDLTHDQEKEVGEIINERLEALLEIRRKIQPQIKEQLTLLKEQMSEVLDEKQAVKWNRKLEHLEGFLLFQDESGE